MKQILYILLFSLSLSGCSGCSRSGHKTSRTSSSTSRRENSTDREQQFSSGDKTVIKMKKEGGVYKIPVSINGVTLNFIFDTGASDICISPAEATVLFRQGTLTEEDKQGVQQYTIADGSTSEALVVKLKSVTIGNRTIYNVNASIIDNLNAPLLLGQSAMQKFGKISIDNIRGEVTFE